MERLTLEYENDRMSRKVGEKLQLSAAKNIRNGAGLNNDFPSTPLNDCTVSVFRQAYTNYLENCVDFRFHSITSRTVIGYTLLVLRPETRA